MSDAVTLIAGILLTSVGLIALVPFVVRLVRSGTTAFAYGSGRLLPEPDADSVLQPPFASPPPVTLAPDDPAHLESSQNLDELMAHLFGLRMIVSEVTAEVQAVQDVLTSAEPEQDSGIRLYALDDEDVEENVA